jgi:hypothetical protein
MRSGLGDLQGKSGAVAEAGGGQGVTWWVLRLLRMLL